MEYVKGYLVTEVPLSRICYDYRDDIAFRIYVLMTNDWDSMDKWRKLKHGRKAERAGSYRPDYLKNLLKAVEETPIKNTKFAWKDVPKKGQILDNVHFAFDKKTGIYYPAGGGSRVALAYFLCHSHIPALLVSTKKGSAWQKKHGIGTKHFDGMPEDIIKKLLFRREINNLFAKAIIKNKIDSEFLYKIPDLGFRGKRSVEELLKNEEFMSAIRGKNVVNFIQDNGYLEVQLAKYCSSILTVGKDSIKLDISRRMANYYGAVNSFHQEHMIPCIKHDAALFEFKSEYFDKVEKKLFNNGEVAIGDLSGC